MKLYIKNEGRLGNQLFQYFFAKKISKHLGGEIYMTKNLIEVFGFNTNIVTHLPSQFCRLYETWNGYKKELFFNNVKISDNFSEILNLIFKSNCHNLVIEGFYQKEEYYSPDKKTIKSMLNISDTIKENVLGIHIRKGDIINTNNELPNCWYSKMIEKFSHHKIYLSTDSPNSEIVKNLLNRGCELYENTPENTIIEFSTFSDLVLSQGTFSWWIGFLSEGNKYNLIPDKGWNSRESDIKLFPKEEKWHYFKMNENCEIEKINYE